MSETATVTTEASVTDRKNASTMLHMLSTLIESGVHPAQAIANCGINRVRDEELELTLEQLWYDRILHPEGKLLSSADDIKTRKPGDLTETELYLIVDLMVYARSLPMPYIATQLGMSLKTIGKVKKDISESYYRIADSGSAEAFLGDYMRRSEDLLMRARHRENVTSSDQNKIQYQKFQYEIINKILDRQQELGKIPKNLGTARIEEEFVVEVRSGGVVSNKRREIPAKADDDTFTDAELLTSSHSQQSPQSPPLTPVANADGDTEQSAPVKFVSDEQMERINGQALPIEQVEKQLQKIGSTPEGSAYLAQRIKDLGARANQNIIISPPEEESATDDEK